MNQRPDKNQCVYVASNILHTELRHIIVIIIIIIVNGWLTVENVLMYNSV